jgi:hypothetical protein
MAASGRFSRGQVVIAPIPYALAQAGTAGKLRPALVIASLSRDDLLVCQITSQPAEDDYDVTLANADFAQGALRRGTSIRSVNPLNPFPKSADSIRSHRNASGRYAHGFFSGAPLHTPPSV